MIIGIPREIKKEELRVAITPAGFAPFVAHGHKVLIERGAVPRTSTYALTNSTLSYALAVADQGLEMSMGSNKVLKKGLNIYKGRVTLGQLLSPLVWTMRKHNSEISFPFYVVKYLMRHSEH